MLLNSTQLWTRETMTRRGEMSKTACSISSISEFGSRACGVNLPAWKPYYSDLYLKTTCYNVEALSRRTARSWLSRCHFSRLKGAAKISIRISITHVWRRVTAFKEELPLQSLQLDGLREVPTVVSHRVCVNDNFICDLCARLEHDCAVIISCRCIYDMLVPVDN